MLNPFDNHDLMNEVVDMLVPSFMNVNDQFKGKCRIKMITFVPFHTDNETCEHCADTPTTCVRCIATLFPPSNEEVKDASAAA